MRPLVRKLLGLSGIGVLWLMSAQGAQRVHTPQESEIEALRRRIIEAADPNKSPHITELTMNELLEELNRGEIEEVRRYLDDLERRQGLR